MHAAKLLFGGFSDAHVLNKNRNRTLDKRPSWLISQAHTSIQIRIVAFNVPQLTQASFLQKKSNIAECFFDVCNAEMAQSLSSFQKSKSYFRTKFAKHLLDLMI
jgi:hypothetical protein